MGNALGLYDNNKKTLTHMREILLKANNEFHSLFSDKKWNVPESSVNAKGIKAVAAEAGVSVSAHELFSDAMGEPGDTVSLHGETYDKGTYIGMIKHNVNTIVDGLK